MLTFINKEVFLSCRKRELLSAESTAKETLVESKAGELVYACASAISSISQTLTGSQVHWLLSHRSSLLKSISLLL